MHLMPSGGKLADLGQVGIVVEAKMHSQLSKLTVLVFMSWKGVPEGIAARV